MRVDFVTCDVFTERPFAGNPLLVVPDAQGLSREQMQAIAREINYSESTFVLPADDPKHSYRQRTFVPLREIPYAGHPTVGTALVMAWLGKVMAGSFTIEVGFGPLALEISERDGRPHRVRMTQGTPAWEAPVSDIAFLDRLAEGLGLPAGALRGPLPVQAVSTGNRFLIVPLPDRGHVERAACDPRMLEALERETGVLGVYLFAPDGERIHARAFCPGAGVPEDPATGSAAGPLGVYLALHRAMPGGGASFVIDQGVEMGRPSEIAVEVAIDRSRPVGVLVSGSAVRMMTGSLEV
jgi:trans-2,3-dihydro-3-hydroxyanthranilate isomerase